MMQVAAVGAATDATTTQQSSESAATSAFGLGFDSLLKIILTQLTYQDPLKPMDNFQFVSQLAQFSQIQQGETANGHLESLVAAQATGQAVSLLGETVDIPAGTGTLTGKVVAVSFDNGSPRVTIETGNDQTISNIAISNISQVRQGE